MPYNIPTPKRKELLGLVQRITLGIFSECEAFNPDTSVNEKGMSHSFWVMKSLICSFFVTALKNGVAPNAVMTDVDAYCKDLKETIMQYATGKIKDGDVSIDPRGT